VIICGNKPIVFCHYRIEGALFNKTENDVVDIQRRIHLSLNPNLCRIDKRKLHSILAKAFSISILTAISPPLPLLDLRVLRISCAKIELSWIWHPDTNAIWKGEIILDKRGFSLLASNLKIIL
jgi:hypothetical protein